MRTLLFLCCVVTAAFGATPALAQDADIRGFWRVVEVRGIDKPDSKLAVQIRDRWLWILSPCWRYGFPLRIQGDRMEIGPSPGWDNCRPNGVGDPSAEALKATLPQITEWALAVGDGHLVLRGSGKTIAVLTPLLPEGIENRWWGVVAYRWGLRLHKLPQPVGAIALVDGTLLGHVSCYDANGTYTLADERIHIEPGLSAILCMQGAEELPKEILPRLYGEHRIQIEDDRLILTDENGRADIVLAARPN